MNETTWEYINQNLEIGHMVAVLSTDGLEWSLELDDAEENIIVSEIYPDTPYGVVQDATPFALIAYNMDTDLDYSLKQYHIELETVLPYRYPSNPNQVSLELDHQLMIDIIDGWFNN